MARGMDGSQRGWYTGSYRGHQFEGADPIPDGTGKEVLAAIEDLLAANGGTLPFAEVSKRYPGATLRDLRAAFKVTFNGAWQVQAQGLYEQPPVSQAGFGQMSSSPEDGEGASMDDATFDRVMTVLKEAGGRLPLWKLCSQIPGVKKAQLMTYFELAKLEGGQLEVRMPEAPGGSSRYVQDEAGHGSPQGYGDSFSEDKVREVAAYIVAQGGRCSLDDLKTRFGGLVEEHLDARFEVRGIGKRDYQGNGRQLVEVSLKQSMDYPSANSRGMQRSSYAIGEQPPDAGWRQTSIGHEREGTWREPGALPSRGGWRSPSPSKSRGGWAQQHADSAPGWNQSSASDKGWDRQERAWPALSGKGWSGTDAARRKGGYGSGDDSGRAFGGGGKGAANGRSSFADAAKAAVEGKGCSSAKGRRGGSDGKWQPSLGPGALGPVFPISFDPAWADFWGRQSPSTVGGWGESNWASGARQQPEWPAESGGKGARGAKGQFWGAQGSPEWPARAGGRGGGFAPGQPEAKRGKWTSSPRMAGNGADSEEANEWMQLLQNWESGGEQAPGGPGAGFGGELDGFNA